MARSPDSLVLSTGGKLLAEKQDDKVPKSRLGGEANPRAATQVNAVSASSTPPASNPTQLEIFPGRACPSKAKPATVRKAASNTADRRDGVQGGGTRRKRTRITGETLFGPAEAGDLQPTGREAYKGKPRNRRNNAEQGVGGGHSTGEPRENRGKGRAATSTMCPKRGKAAGLPPRGKATHRRTAAPREKKPPKRMDPARKLQRTLYRAAKQGPERRFTLLYDKVCRPDILEEAWRRVRLNGGAAGVDKVSIEEIREHGEQRFLDELQQELRSDRYRVSHVRRVHIPKPGQPGKTRPLGIPTVKDRVVQMAVKLIIEPLFEADFRACSFGFRPGRSARMALNTIVKIIKEGLTHVADVDLKSYFDTIDHDLLIRLVERRVGDIKVQRLIRAWLKAGVMEEGKVTNPTRGSPQGGVISPLLSNIFLHEVDRQWCGPGGEPTGRVRLIRYADDMVLLARSEAEAQTAWERFQSQIADLHLTIQQEKSRLTTAEEGFAFLGFEFRQARHRPLYLWPRHKAQTHIMERVRETVRSVPSSVRLDEVIRKVNPVLNGWCTYFRVGNSNRVFHKVDWQVRGEVQLWLRRKHQCTWPHAKKRWNYGYLHGRCRLYRMVGKVSHLEALERMPPGEGGRRAVCGKTARTVR
jgi:RNA-directed DNA polymerase